MTSFFEFLRAGGFIMWPLVICSLAVWVVIFERLFRYRRLGSDLRSFHLEAMNSILRGERESLKALCADNLDLPTSRLITLALERLQSRDQRLRDRWLEAVERRRQLLNQELRQGLWVLGTIGTSAPFIGLFGTVVGILRSFQEMAKTGTGGFAVVAAGISEALIATAGGIVVAVVAVMAYNAFQTRCASLILLVKVQTEELVEVLAGSSNSSSGGEN